MTYFPDSPPPVDCYATNQLDFQVVTPPVVATATPQWLCQETYDQVVRFDGSGILSVLLSSYSIDSIFSHLTSLFLEKD